MSPPWGRSRRSGFSLLEVILALAILAGALAILGEAARSAMRNAEAARDTARAQLLCESKMAEIVGGITAAESAEDITLTTEDDTDEASWHCSISVDPLDQEGLLTVRVTVARGQPAEKAPVRYSLVRWMRDPSASGADSSADQAGGQDSDSNSSGANSGGSSGQGSGSKPSGVSSIGGSGQGAGSKSSGGNSGGASGQGSSSGGPSSQKSSGGSANVKRGGR